jgi:hypothetical protein
MPAGRFPRGPSRPAGVALVPSASTGGRDGRTDTSLRRCAPDVERADAALRVCVALSEGYSTVRHDRAAPVSGNVYG